MSEFDNFDRIFEEMIRIAERIFDASPVGFEATPHAVQREAPSDEIIERKDSMVYILNAPGYEEGQLLVSVLEDEVEVKAPDFMIKKPLPSRVNPASASCKYRNGVLSVTVKKRQ
ncbi:MAG: Hsp20/alpha crystallin family protein [Nitrososphaerales archaeon]|nr:Hsp20/alpha crystallin family protein [Nitrososphaerales archaeon]